MVFTTWPMSMLEPQPITIQLLNRFPGTPYHERPAVCCMMGYQVTVMQMNQPLSLFGNTAENTAEGNEHKFVIFNKSG